MNLDACSDEDLLTGSLHDPELFVTFYDRHARGLLAFFARRTFDSQVAADLTAETLADAFASRQRFRDRGAGSASAWLYTIGRRKLGRFIRRHGVESRARTRLAMELIEVGHEDTDRIEDLIDFEAIGRAVARALGRLNADQREALQLRVIEGVSYAEASRRLGCTQDVVRARVSRGLKRLGAELETR